MPGSATSPPPSDTAPSSTTNAYSWSRRSGSIVPGGRTTSSTPRWSVSAARRGRVPGELAHEDGARGRGELDVRAARRGVRRPAGRDGSTRAVPPTAARPAARAPEPVSSSACATPCAGRHQVELAGTDGLLGAEAVEVEQLPGQQPGHGLETHVRVGSDTDLDALVRSDGTHVVGEAPGADGASGPLRQDPSHPHRSDRGLATGQQLQPVRRRRLSLGHGDVVRRDRTTHCDLLTPCRLDAPAPGRSCRA